MLTHAARSRSRTYCGLIRRRADGLRVLPLRSIVDTDHVTCVRCLSSLWGRKAAQLLAYEPGRCRDKRIADLSRGAQ